MLANRPKGLCHNKNAANVQQQQLLGHHPTGVLGAKSSKTPSPPQLKSLKQRADNENDLGALMLLNHQQQLKDLDQPLKPQQALQELQQLKQYHDKEMPAAIQPAPLEPPPALRQQGLKRKSMIPRLVSELAERDAKRETELIEDIDDVKGTREDHVFLACEIAKDIYAYMFQLEDTMAIDQDFLREQKVFLPKVRQRLVSWCVDIHSQLKLLPETLYMSISVMDRYFQNVIVKQQSQVQLVGIAATLIASKYEEIYPPEIDDLIHLTRNAYSKREVLRMEIEILERLKFDLGKPIPLAFLRRFSRAAHCDLKMHTIAKWLMETSLPHYECTHWRPSQLAATALFTTLYLIHRDNTFSFWNKTLQHYTNYTRQQLMEPAATLCKIVKKFAPPNPKFAELRSIQVDQLIKMGDLYQQRQLRQQQQQQPQTQ